MMIPENILSHAGLYGSQYFNEVRDLLENVKNSDDSEKLKLFEEFSKKFTVFPSLWLFWYRYEILLTSSQESFMSLKNMHFNSPEIDEEVYKGLTENRNIKSSKHYYFNYNTKNWCNILGKKDSVEFNKDIKHLTTMMHLPHIGLEELGQDYNKCINEHTSNSPFPRNFVKKHEIALKLFEALKIIERNPELWIKYLSETDDSEFIVNSCEYRLGKNPEDQDFWNAYIKYLKETNNSKMLLKTYSRYCRLFLYNSNMNEEYFKEISEAKLESKLKWWIDWITLKRILTNEDNCIAKSNEILFENYSMPLEWSFPLDDFDRIFVRFVDIIKEKEIVAWKEEEDKQVHMALPTEVAVPIPTSITPAGKQFFTLPKHTIEHIASNAPPLLLLKLQMLCKYFWLKNDTIYCHRMYASREVLSLSSTPAYIENSLLFNPDDFEKLKLQKYHLGYGISTRFIKFTPKSDQLLSNILGNIRSHSLRYLTITTQKLTWKEFEFLTAPKTLTSINLHRINIQKNNDFAKIEDVIELFPNVSSLSFQAMPLKCTSESAHNLAALNRTVKFNYFYLDQITDIFNPSDFGVFIKKNAASEAHFQLVWTDRETQKISEGIIKDIVYDGDNEFDDKKMIIMFRNTMFQ